MSLGFRQLFNNYVRIQNLQWQNNLNWQRTDLQQTLQFLFDFDAVFLILSNEQCNTNSRFAGDSNVKLSECQMDVSCHLKALKCSVGCDRYGFKSSAVSEGDLICRRLGCLRRIILWLFAHTTDLGLALALDKGNHVSTPHTLEKGRHFEEFPVHRAKQF